MIPKILKYILCFFLCTAIAIPLSFGVSAATTKDNISTVQAPSTVDSGIRTAITNAGGEVKGLIGNIIANIFDRSQMIKNEFIAAFQSIRDSFTNNVPKWDGGKFVESPIYSSGGNVGIGTDDPKRALHIVSPGENVAIRLQDNDANWFLTTTTTDGFGIHENNTNTAGSRLNIDAGGNVGIGTTNPSTKLHVNGGITGDYFYSQNNTSSKVISGGNDGSNGGSILMRGGGVLTNPSDIRFRAGSATNMILKGNTGNVGIGIVSPSAKLHVEGRIHLADSPSLKTGRIGVVASDETARYDEEYVIGFKDGDDRSSIFISTHDSGGQGRIQIDAGTIEMRSRDSDAAFNLMPDGRIGLGTKSPEARLHVDGNIVAQDPSEDDHVATKKYVDSSISTGFDPGFCMLCSKSAKKCEPFNGEWLNVAGDVKIVCGTSLWLYTKKHNTLDCEMQGGRVRKLEGNDLCIIPQPSCPSGWSQYKSYTETEAKTCKGRGTCHGAKRKTCTTGFHPLSNTNVQETCGYMDRTKRWFSCSSRSKTCTANITKIACY